MTKLPAPLQLSFLLLALSLPIGPSAAQTTVRVQSRDLNLGSEEGQASLDRRIDRAVETVCRLGGFGDLALALASRRCRTATLRQVMPQRAQLLALHGRNRAAAAE